MAPIGTICTLNSVLSHNVITEDVQLVQLFIPIGWFMQLTRQAGDESEDQMKPWTAHAIDYIKTSIHRHTFSFQSDLKGPYILHVKL